VSVALGARVRPGAVAYVRGQQALVCSEMCRESAHHLDALRPVLVGGRSYSAQAASRRLGTCVWCSAVLRGADLSVEPTPAGGAQ
jgi:hypothetical protein